MGTLSVSKGTPGLSGGLRSPGLPGVPLSLTAVVNTKLVSVYKFLARSLLGREGKAGVVILVVSHLTEFLPTVLVGRPPG